LQPPGVVQQQRQEAICVAMGGRRLCMGAGFAPIAQQLAHLEHVPAVARQSQ
jgi:hypothetical protein